MLFQGDRHAAPSVPGQNVRFSDNAFDLIPYVSQDVVAIPGAGVTLDNLKETLKIEHCNFGK